MIDMDRAIATAMKTGKVMLGGSNAAKNAKLGRGKLIVLASNCPSNVREDVTYYAKLSGVPVVIYKGASIDLGMTCGKPFAVSAMTIREPGDSDILKTIQEDAEASDEETEMTTAEETDE
ncbi:MAG TPA: 50S ribosomal protein L30e [Candidatus Bathyarchaeia archaeon]|nr:50S ribosomal protein L30e [Candidatus Bathyarchaeia archaeon]